MERVICLVIGYLFGMFQTAFFYGKIKGIDIREHGSGNAGTTNTLRVLGKKAGIIVFIGDVFKCVIAILVTRLIFTKGSPDIIDLLVLYTGAGAILGHNYPFYLNFKGGKGIAATAGLMISIHPIFIPVGFVLFFGNLALTHYVSLGSLLLYIGFFTEMVITGQMGLFGASQPVLIEMYIIVFLLGVLAFYKHRQNIVRLIKGEERKTYLFKKNEQK